MNSREARLYCQNPILVRSIIYAIVQFVVNTV